jgi:apolipoprotein D and lipocalin family protein
MRKLFLLSGLLPFLGCAAARPKLTTVPNVQLPRYMGSWYVIASIPPSIEKEAFNSVENYTLAPDGSIPTVFTYNKGSLTGPQKIFKSRGHVVDTTNNSTWKIQMYGILRLEYLITYLDDEYTQVIVSRNKRDYVWIMARTPTIADADYARLVDQVKMQGYDISKLRKVPHNAGS